jgi:hypothetical protein
MGKSAKNKKNRAASAAAAPLPTAGIDDTLTNGSTDGNPPAPTTAAPVLAQLSALDASDRAWAAASVAHLSSDPTVRPALMQGNVVGKLIMLLSDSPEIAVEAAGSLRNIVLGDPDESGQTSSVAGGLRRETTVEEVYRKDGMTPLLALVPKFAEFFRSGLHLMATTAQAANEAEDGEEGGAEKLTRKQKKAAKAAAAANGTPVPNGHASGAPKEPKKKQDDAKTVLELAEQSLALLWIMRSVLTRPPSFFNHQLTLILCLANETPKPTT